MRLMPPADLLGIKLPDIDINMPWYTPILMIIPGVLFALGWIWFVARQPKDGNITINRRNPMWMATAFIVMVLAVVGAYMFVANDLQDRLDDYFGDHPTAIVEQTLTLPDDTFVGSRIVFCVKGSNDRDLGVPVVGFIFNSEKVTVRLFGSFEVGIQDFSQYMLLARERTVKLQRDNKEKTRNVRVLTLQLPPPEILAQDRGVLYYDTDVFGKDVREKEIKNEFQAAKEKCGGGTSVEDRNAGALYNLGKVWAGDNGHTDREATKAGLKIAYERAQSADASKEEFAGKSPLAQAQENTKQKIRTLIRNLNLHRLPELKEKYGIDDFDVEVEFVEGLLPPVSPLPGTTAPDQNDSTGSSGKKQYDLKFPEELDFTD